MVLDEIAELMLQTTAFRRAEPIVEGVVTQHVQILVIMPPAARVAEEFSRVIADQADELVLLRLNDALVAHHEKPKPIAKRLSESLLLQHRLISGLRPRFGLDPQREADERWFLCGRCAPA